MRHVMTWDEAENIRKRLANGDRPKVIALDGGYALSKVYNVKNNKTFYRNFQLERELERIERVTKALEENPYAPIRQLVKASRVSFKNLKQIAGERIGRSNDSPAP